MGLKKYIGRIRRLHSAESYLEMCQVDKPLVLHLRGSKHYGSDVATSARLILSQFADPKQNWHIYCFTDTHTDVQKWKYSFPDAYFGFTALLNSFDERKTQALRGHLLIETDSPYMPLGSHLVNTPAFICDIALNVSQIRGVSTADILLATKENAVRLFD